MFVANRHVGVKTELNWIDQPHCHWYLVQLFEYWMVIWYQHQIGASLIAFVTEIRWIWSIFWVVLQLCYSCAGKSISHLIFCSVNFSVFSVSFPLPSCPLLSEAHCPSIAETINQSVKHFMDKRSVDSNLQMVVEFFQPKLFLFYVILNRISLAFGHFNVSLFENLW